MMASDVMTSGLAAQTRGAEHRFFAAMAAFAVLVVALGFGSSYGPRLAGAAPPTTALVHVHAAVFSLWLMAFVAQVTFAVRGRMALHRRLGTASIALAAIMLLVGAATAVQSGRLGHHGIPGVDLHDPAAFLLLNLSSLFVFGTLCGAAYLLRGRPAAHKRLMLMATVGGLLPPAIARLPGIAGHAPAIAAVAMAALLVGPIVDLVLRRRVHLAYLAGLAVALGSIPPVVEKLSATAAWHEIAAHLI
jgi:hypothetical protein